MTAPAAWPMRKQEAAQLNDDEDDTGELPAPVQALPDQGPAGAVIGEMADLNPAEWTWNRAYLLLGAARRARYRMQFADTWTYFAGGCFLAWTTMVLLGR